MKMKNKKILFLLCLIVFLLSFSVVSAKDNNTSTHTKEVKKVSNDISSTKLDKAVTKKDNKKTIANKNKTNNVKSAIAFSKESVNNSELKTSGLTKKNTEKTVKEYSYYYDEDEEYGLDTGTTITLSVNKVKTNQYNISAKVINSFNHPVKEGTLDVHLTGINTKTVTFINGYASYIQKFHSYGKKNIYASIKDSVAYESGTYYYDGVEYADYYEEKVKIKSETLSFYVIGVNMYTSIPSSSDIDDKIRISSEITDDYESVGNKGIATIFVDNKKFESKKLSDGLVNFNLNIKKVGKHVIDLDYKTFYGETYTDTGVVEITRKVEKITLTLPSYGDTCEQIVIETKVTNDTQILKRGYVILKNNGKQFAKIKLKNGETTSIYRLPNESDSYKITANYVNKGKTLATASQKVTVYDVETFKFNPIKTASTGAKKKVKATVTNPYIKVNYGRVEILINGETLLNKAVKKGVVSGTITIPDKAGTYKMEAQYIKGRYIIREISKNIKITNSEKLSYKFTKNLVPNQKYKFKVKVKSPNYKVNVGKVQYKIGSKKITAKVRNGVATINYKTGKKEQTLTATVSYMKYGKVVDKKTSKIEIYYPYMSYMDMPLDTYRGKKVKITTYVYDDNYQNANSGKAIFYLNKKKIGTAKIKHGKAVINYKVNLNAGIYKFWAVCLDNKKRKISEDSYQYLTVVNQLTNDKHLLIKTITPSYDYSENNLKDIGSNEQITAWYYPDDSKYNAYVQLTHKTYYYPRTHKLVKARFYYYSNGKVTTKVYGESSIFANYVLSTKNYNSPYKVEAVYRKMNYRERRAMKEFFTAY